MQDELGERMKEQYEHRTRFFVPRRTYTIIRLDGKAFHTYTRESIHHISRSALIWSHAVVEHPEFSDKYHDVVLHNILSHHGSREWGSPVAPKTQAAWLLHLCDGISARMNDCDRLDLVHGKPKGAQ